MALLGSDLGNVGPGGLREESLGSAGRSVVADFAVEVEGDRAGQVGPAAVIARRDGVAGSEDSGGAAHRTHYGTRLSGSQPLPAD
jgi:hypothetical protein